MSVTKRQREYIELPASALMAHPLNPRTHPEAQMDALRGSLKQFGDVRSLLAYRSPKKWPGKIVLIDGHARQAVDSDRLVNVEILTDLTDEEAEALLLTIDPLAQLAGFDAEKIEELRKTVSADDDNLQALWDSLEANAERVSNSLEETRQKRTPSPEEGATKYQVLIECDNERQQQTLFKKLKRDGVTCKLLTV